MTGAAFLVARLVERMQHFRRKLACLGQDSVDHFRRRVFETGEVRIFLEVENLVEDEPDFADRSGITGHDLLLSSQGGNRIEPATILYDCCALASAMAACTVFMKPVSSLIELSISARCFFSVSTFS